MLLGYPSILIIITITILTCFIRCGTRAVVVRRRTAAIRALHDGQKQVFVCETRERSNNPQSQIKMSLTIRSQDTNVRATPFLLRISTLWFSLCFSNWLLLN
jgi:hypothetical protein